MVRPEWTNWLLLPGDESGLKGVVDKHHKEMSNMLTVCWSQSDSQLRSNPHFSKGPLSLKCLRVIWDSVIILSLINNQRLQQMFRMTNTCLENVCVPVKRQFAGWLVGWPLLQVNSHWLDD